MADRHSTNGKPIPAAAYVRMSSGKQEKSPAEQRTELTKLAAREGCTIVRWFSDEAITGDTGTEDRPGLAALLAGAQAGEFSVVLAWHTNRLSRQDPMDAVVFYNQLRKAGVGLHTCCEGRIDLQDFSRQLLLFVNQKANHDYLREHSAKILRGKITAAKAGGRPGGPAAYGTDRGLFDCEGRLVRRLAPGEAARLPGCTIRSVPTDDPAKLAAVRYAFQRYDTAAVSFRKLAHELEAKGYPAPPCGHWNPNAVANLLANPIYVGTARFGNRATGKYHRTQGQDIATVIGNKTVRVKPQEEWILRPGAFQGIIPVALFKRVQAKLPNGPRQQRKPKAVYPLSGLVFCGHCGKPMIGARNGGDGGVRYWCQTYHRHGAHNPTNCGCHTIDAGAIETWLANALREYYLGPGRAELVEKIKRRLRAEAKTGRTERNRLEKQAVDLERQVDRLVKAIRTTDAPELVGALDQARRERQSVQEALRQAEALQDLDGIDQAAEAVVSELWGLETIFREGDPPKVQELFRRLVQRIECRWERVPCRRGKGLAVRYQLTEGEAYVWPPLQFVTCARYDEW